MTDKKYYDSNNREYKVGDIVFNPFFGDYWLVEEYTEEEQSETDCLYCLSLYGDRDEYYMDIDEPAGFIIICSKDEPDYNKYIEEFKQIIKRRKEQEAQWEKDGECL